MKEFDYEKAKAGAPVCTRDGRSVRIICRNAKCGDYPIVALIEDNEKEEHLHLYTIDGRYSKYREDDRDIMMATTKYHGWVNVYRHKDGSVYLGEYHATFEEAQDKKSTIVLEYMATVKIEWVE